MRNKIAAFGAIHAFIAVALGAFAAHGLEGRISSDMLDVFETGARYHMYHALGMILTGTLAEWTGSSKLLMRGGQLLHAGIILFAGSLYALSLSGISKLGIITPFGGLAFLAGWACIAIAAWNGRQTG